MLERKYTDLYPNKLKQEYQFYAEKYRLRPMVSKNWKFFRLRPSSFPSLRISHLADFVFKSESLFNKLFNFKNLKELLPLFNFTTSDYWKFHYVFDKKLEFDFGRVNLSPYRNPISPAKIAHSQSSHAKGPSKKKNP